MIAELKSLNKKLIYNDKIINLRNKQIDELKEQINKFMNINENINVEDLNKIYNEIDKQKIKYESDIKKLKNINDTKDIEIHNLSNELKKLMNENNLDINSINYNNLIKEKKEYHIIMKQF